MKKIDYKLKKIISVCIVIAAATAVLSYSALLFVFEDLQKRHFANYESAMATNEATGYAVPYFLPKSATDIHLQYGLEPSFLWVEFSYDLKDQQTLIADFQKLPSPEDENFAFDKMLRKSWVENIPAKQVNIFEIKLPEGRQRVRETYLVIDPVRGRAWYSVD